MGELHQRTTETMPVVSAVGFFFFPTWYLYSHGFALQFGQTH